MRVKMIVAYDGTNYSGWQVQPNGITIEQKLNEALTALLKEEIKVTGASRTDAGVHSLGNVCIFDTTTRMPAEKISYAVNQRLPEDIVVQDSCDPCFFLVLAVQLRQILRLTRHIQRVFKAFAVQHWPDQLNIIFSCHLFFCPLLIVPV